MHVNNRSKVGFTLIEIMIVVGILMVLMTVLMVNTIPSFFKGRDGRRKADLHKISTALEEYYNDKGMYPDKLSASAVSACGQTTVLSEYLKNVPCDPSAGVPYEYYPQQCSSGLCRSYGLYAVLEKKGDSDIQRLGCGDANGCYQSAGITYNYGVAGGTIVDSNGD